MFRDVPECSGMFHVPGFIDDRVPMPRFVWNVHLFDKKSQTVLFKTGIVG